MLSGTLAKIYGHAGLPHDTIQVSFKGTAGQAFGAWLARGVTFDLEGEGNDYVGKGLSGGRIIVKPPRDSGIVPEGIHHRRQHRDVRRDRGRIAISAASPASVSRCATPAPSRWSRAPAIIAANT